MTVRQSDRFIPNVKYRLLLQGINGQALDKPIRRPPITDIPDKSTRSIKYRTMKTAWPVPHTSIPSSIKFILDLVFHLCPLSSLLHECLSSYRV